MKELRAKLDISVGGEGANMHKRGRPNQASLLCCFLIWLEVTLIGARANFVLWVEGWFAK